MMGRHRVRNLTAAAQILFAQSAKILLAKSCAARQNSRVRYLMMAIDITRGGCGLFRREAKDDW